MADILDLTDKFKETDKSGMYGKVFSIPDMLERTWAMAKGSGLKVLEGFNNIIISGMGGSAISGDIAAGAYSEEIKCPVIVNRGYELPAFASEKTLFIAVSYSGNTEETLSAYDKAAKKKCKIVTISSGGKLEEVSRSAGSPHIKLDPGFPPRAALGYILPSVLYVFSKAGVAGGIEEDLTESVSLLRKMREKYSIEQPSKSNEIKQMASKMQGKVPVIISCIDNTYPAGMRLKTQLNENSKMTALHITFPELNHNDMVNFSFLKPAQHNYFTIVLRDQLDSDRMRKRVEITKSLISSEIGGFNEVWTQGKSKLARILSLVMYGDLLSVYAGVMSGVDPTPVTIIEQLKKELSR